jgi:hypothetical protein
MKFLQEIVWEFVRGWGLALRNYEC